jgi:hypothetical protein
MSDSPGLRKELKDRDSVITVATALQFLSPSEIRWRVDSRQWQRVARAVLVTHNGPLTEGQRLRVAQLWGGPGAVIGGFAAAKLDGLRWLAESTTRIDLLRPPGRRFRLPPEFLNVVPHYSKLLGERDVHPLHVPPRTRIERSLIDAASWAPNDRLAMAVLAAGVQQGLTLPQKPRTVLDQDQTRFRHRLLVVTLGDIEGGAQALSELDFTRKVVRAFGLPAPERQSARRDSQGRRRYIDVVWEEWKVAVEIDGAQHFRDPLQRWDDTQRDIDLQLDGYEVLRFPAWMVRHSPGIVARKIQASLRHAGRLAATHPERVCLL